MKTETIIVMIGSSCIDEYYEMEYIPKLGEKAIVRSLGNKVGGMIGNAAAVATAYGMESYLMDTVNPGGNTDLALKNAEEAGIRLDMIRYDESLSEVKCLIFLKDGERIIYVTPTDKRNLAPDAEQKAILKKAAYVYTSIEELKCFRDTLGFMDWLHSVQSQIVLDVEYLSGSTYDIDWEIVQKANIIFVNLEGDEQLREKISAHYRELLLERGCMVVATKGDKGCVVFTAEGDIYECPAYPIVPADTTGAGDTFNASFIYGLSQGWAVNAAGDFANGAAARSTLEMGPRSGVVGEKVVKEFMSKWKGEVKNG